MRARALAALLAISCAEQPRPPSSLQQRLERAADLEGVPRPLLIAMAYVDSRLTMNAPSPDGGYGLLHLIDRDDAPPSRSLARAARLTGLSTEALRTDPFANARGGAALLRAEAESLFGQFHDLDERRLGDWWMVVMRMSGVEDARTADSYASQVYRVLRDGLAIDAGGELVRLLPQEYDASARTVWGAIEQDLSGEYCPNGACVSFVPASTSNYTPGRGGNTITTIVIHDMEGSYAGSIAWFQNPSAQASAHFDVRSSDGEISQQVHDSDTAWHAGNWTVNQHAIGIEHEGYAHTGYTWYTEAMYRSSAALVRWLTSTYGVPRDRSHIIGHYEVPDPNHAGWYGGASNHHDPCDSWAGNPTWHNNVACYWDWAHYMDLVTGGGGPTVGSPPVLKITQPLDGGTLDSSPATVRGMVSDATVTSAKVNGQVVAVSNGAFAAAVALVLGPNTIAASATNSGGVGTAAIHVTYAPPQTGVQGRVSSADGPVANAAVSLATGSVHTVTAIDGSYAIGAAPGTYALSVDAEGFLPLSQNVTIPAGKVVTVDLIVHKPAPDSPPPAPHIRIDTPDEGSTIDTDTVLVSGVAEVPDLHSLRIGDEQVDFDSSGAFSVMAPLRLGPNDLIVTATRGSGATIAATVHVEFAPVALSRTGCDSASAADLIAMLMLGLLAPRRRNR
ncbi:MAG: N-acetylmuramoyl-L-alanine amidase [Myxococcales bacterium]